MTFDIHAHYIPSDSLLTAGTIGEGYGLEAERDKPGRGVVTRDGKLILAPRHAEYYDLDLRMSIMVGRQCPGTLTREQ